MQQNPNSANRSTSVNPSRPKFYDPSEPYRALLNSENNHRSEDPTMAYDIPTTNIDLKTGLPKQIPQYFYPMYDDQPIERPNLVQPMRPAPFVQQHPPPAPVHTQAVPVVIQQPPQNMIQPYSHPMVYPTDPYSSGQYYPYSQPYLIPLTSSVPHSEPAPVVHERSKSDVIAAHQQDADLSRLEVYHFTPKQEGSSKGTSVAQSAQPIIQYHVYPHAPAAVPTPPVPQQYPPYSQNWSNYPPNGPPHPPNGPSYPPNGHPYPSNGSSYPPNVPPYVTEPPHPLAETRARGSQTEPPPMKNRAVSPMYTTAPSMPYDEDGHPYIQHRNTRTDRHLIQTGRVDQRFYEGSRSTPLSDCRCLDCQRERSKVLNYYPD